MRSSPEGNRGSGRIPRQRTWASAGLPLKEHVYNESMRKGVAIVIGIVWSIAAVVTVASLVTPQRWLWVSLVLGLPGATLLFWGLRRAEPRSLGSTISSALLVLLVTPLIMLLAVLLFMGLGDAGILLK